MKHMHYIRNLTVAALATMALTAVWLLPAAQAVDRDFDNGGGDLTWTNALNWTGDGVPNGDNVFVTGNWIITLDDNAAAVNEIGLVRTGGGAVTVNQTTGSLTVNSWFNLAQGLGGGGGTGTWNMSGSSVLNVTHSSGGQTSIGVGYATSPAYDTGILTLSDTAQFLQTANEFRIGGELNTSRAKGTVTLNNSSKLSVTGGGALIVGNAGNGSTGALNINDSAQVTAAGVVLIGNNTGASGSVVQGGTSTFTASGAWFSIGAFGSGSYTLNGGTLTFTGQFGLNVGDNTGGTGTLTVNGGQVNVTGPTTPDIYIGKYNATGTISVKNSAQVTVNRDIFVGFNGAATGTLNISDTATVTCRALMVYDGTGNINVSGGNVTATGWITLGQATGNATMTQSGGTVTTPELWTTWKGTGTYNLNGGTLAVGKFSKDSGTSTFNFNGGTLKATAGWTLDDTKLTTAQVRNGGAVIDSNGYSITISKALVNYTGETGSLTKAGTGTLTLTAANTYTGGTTINAGVLQLGDGTNGRDGSIANTSSVANNASLIYNLYGSQTASYAISGTGALTKSGVGTLTLSGNNISAGAMTVNGGVLNLNDGAQLASSGIVLIGSGGTGTVVQNGTSTFSCSGAWFSIGVGGSNGSYTLNGGTLTVTSPFGLNVGDTGAGTGTLTVNGGTVNAPNLYVGKYSGVSGVLTQSGGTVNATGFIRVADLGGGVLTLSGTGAMNTTVGLQVATGSGFGTVNLDGGTITTPSVSSGGIGISTFHFNGGALKASISTATFMQGLGSADIKAGGAIIDTNGKDITVAQALLAGSSNGGLTKTGGGTLTMSGLNTYTGNTTISAGTLTLANGGGLTFAIQNSGVNSQITGTGAVNLNGAFSFDLSLAGTNLGDSWTIVDIGLTKSYSPTTFSVTGFTPYGSDLWEITTFGGITYQFSESSGILSVTAIAIPEPNTLALVGLGLLGTMLLGRRFRRTV